MQMFNKLRQCVRSGYLVAVDSAVSFRATTITKRATTMEETRLELCAFPVKRSTDTTFNAQIQISWPEMNGVKRSAPKILYCIRL